MSNELKPGHGSFYFSILRRAERHLSVRALCSILKPFAFVRAALNTAFKDPRPRETWPECLEPVWTRQLARRRRMNGYLNEFLQCLPDRLAHPKWKDNRHINGLDHLLRARQSGRPVVVAFCHFGPIYFMRPWLQAAGIPSGIFVAGTSKNPSEKIQRTHHRLYRYPHIPPRFHLDQLKEAAEFLAAGNVLFVAIDIPSGRWMEVPFCDGWSFQMATGAVRLAIRHHAELIPCTIIDKGNWRFRIELGPPVPQEYLTDKSGWVSAGKHLLSEMFPHFQASPEQCGYDLIMSVRKNDAVRRPEILNS